jgi:hypothetical protein
MKTTSYKTPEQVVEEGFAVLVKGLGPGRALEYLHHYEGGRGDYTEERRQIFRNVTLDDLKRTLLAGGKAAV